MNKDTIVYLPIEIKEGCELPKEDGLYTCELEKKEHGVRTEIASFMEYRNAYGAFHDNQDGFKVKTWLKPITLQELIEGKEKELQELRQWKKEAIEVMPDMQRIGKLIGVPLGQSVHDKIIPFLESIQTK